MLTLTSIRVNIRDRVRYTYYDVLSKRNMAKTKMRMKDGKNEIARRRGGIVGLLVTKSYSYDNIGLCPKIS